MPQLPFPSGYAELENLPKSRETLANCFNNQEGAIIPRPGIDTLTSLNGIARGQFVWNGALYQVSSTELVKITNTTTGANTVIGAIAGNEIIDTAIGFNTAVIVVKGGEIYTLDKTDTLVSILGNPNIVSCDAVTHINGRFVYVPSDGSQPSFFSDVGDAGSVQVLSFFDAEELPDNNETAFNLRNTLYIGGTDSFELFRDTGASPVPFQRLTGARIDYGFIGGLVAYSDTYAFIGREKDQDHGVYLINQGRADKISNAAIDKILSTHTLEDLSNAIASRFKWRSYDILTFTLSTDSFGYFAGEWFILSKLIDGTETPWNGGFINQFKGEYFSASLKKVGKLSNSNTEFGEIIPRYIDIPFQNPNNDWFSAQSISIAISQGFNPGTRRGPEKVLNGTFDDHFGPNLVTNSGFNSDTDWIKGVGWTIGSGVASCDGTQVLVSGVEQELVYEVGKTYRIEFEIISTTASFITVIRLGGAVDGTNFSAVGTHFVDITTLNNTGFLEVVGNIPYIGSIDNVTVREIIEYWNLGTGWTIENGVADCDGSQSSPTSISQSLDISALNKYTVTFEITEYTAGVLSVSLGGTTASKTFNSVGEYTLEITTTSATGDLLFTGDASFIGKIDNVSVTDEVVVNPTVGVALSRNNVEYGEFLYRDVGIRGEYSKHLDWNYPGGLGAYDGFMGLRIYTTQNVDFDTNGLFMHLRS